MRILAIGFRVDDSRAEKGEQWAQATGAFVLESFLYADCAPGVYDFDIFIVNPVQLGDTGSSPPTPEIGGQITERVQSGAVLICFAAQDRMGWLPIRFDPHGGGGTRVDVTPGHPFSHVLATFRDDTRYRTTFSAGRWQVLETNTIGAPVAGWATLGRGHVVILPWFKQPHKVIAALLDRVLPKLAPHLFREDMPAEEPPDWLHEFPVPGAPALAEEMAKLDERIRQLQDLRDQRSTECQQLEELQGLLWWTGVPLQRAAQRALNLLGVKAEPKGLVDLVVDLEDGSLFIEIEGPEGPVRIGKGRQLLDYIASHDQPETVRGAILANPYRRKHPSDRPPTGSQTGLFTTDLQRMAQTHDWRLLTTKDLFEYVVRYLQGDTGAADDARNWLGL